MERWTTRVAWGVGVWVSLALSGSSVVQGQVTYQVFPITHTAAEQVIHQPTGQTALVSLDVTDSTVLFVVNDILRQAHLQEAGDATSPAFVKRTTVKIAQVPAMEALAIVLHGTGLVAKLAPDGETVVIREGVAKSHSVANGTVIGRVTDSASGQGLGGAAVRVAGTKLSTVTSDSGNFTLHQVPVGEQVLSVRLFGYKPADRAVTVVDSERTSVRIVLTSVPTVLSGVVTTAAGLQRKVEVGNDITTINVDSVMKVAPIMTVTDLLETRVPGLTVLHSSGAPGDPSRIRIRGASSIYGNNDPIIIIDGIRVYASQSDPRNDNLAPSAIGRNSRQYIFADGTASGKSTGYAAPSPLDQIDPNSIETIEVFKGPSASALYGSDAANGVIVITTKHGRAGPTRWAVNLGAGLNTEPGDWPTNYYRFGYGAYSSAGSLFCAWNDQTCTTDSVVGFQALNDSRYTVFANHGTDQSYSATVSGGVPTLQYSFTGTSTGDIGLLKLPGIEVQRFEKFYNEAPPSWMLRPQQYQTWGLTGQVTAHPVPSVNITVSSGLLNSNQQNSSLEGAVSQLAGIYIDPLILGSNPLVTQFVERATDHQLTSNNAATVQWQVLPWLPINATGGINIIQRTDETLIPYGINSAGGSASFCVGTCASDTTGSYGLGRGTSQVNTFNLGTRIPTFQQRLTLDLGGNVTSQSTNDFSAYTTQLAPGVSSPSSFPTTVAGETGSPSSFGQTTTAGSTYGVYAQTSLHVFGLYLNPGFRLDGGSASGANGSSGALGLQGLTGLPKIDLSYLLIDQSKPRGPLTLFRPRIALGRAETEPGPTEKLRLFQSDSVISLNGDTSFTSNVLLSTLGNTQLQPETSTELEGGFDAELWHGRLSMTWTQYNKTRRNAIISVPVAPSVAGPISVENINVGVIRNTGHELTMHVQVLQSRAIGWYIGGTMSNDQNVVVRLNKGLSTIDLGNGVRVEAGYPLFSRWALPIAAFADANHDGIIEGTEVRYGDSAVYVGQGDPKYQLNLNTGLTLFNGRLSMNATFAYTSGLTQFNDGAIQSGAFALLPNTPGTSLATQAAVVAAVGGGTCAGGSICQSVTNIGVVQTVNTLRFNALAVTYTVPHTFSRLVRVPTMSVALEGSNLALHSNYHGKDPDVNAFSTVSSGDATEDLGQVPEPRTWWLKVSVGN